jgi:hypothetical protein
VQSGTDFSEPAASAAIKSLFPNATITSQQRSPAQNAAVGGVGNSMHLDGQAIDFTVPGQSAEQVQAALAAHGYPVTEFLDEKAGDPHSTGPHLHWGWGAKGQPSNIAPQEAGQGDGISQFIAANWNPQAAQKWMQQGGHWDQLPANVRTALGRKLLGGGGASAPSQPQMAANGRSVLQGGPVVPRPVAQGHIPSAAERQAFPGAIFIGPSGKPEFPPANASTVADSQLEPPDTHSQSILAATGIPLEAFYTLTGQASKLPRDKTTRSVAFKTAKDFANKRGVDVSTFASQYEAQNEVLQSNLKRYNQTSVMEGEIRGTIANLKPVADAVGMGKLRVGNVLQAAAGREVNDPTVMQYAFQLQQLRAEIAGYNGALQGRTGNNITEQDLREADNVIRNGMNSGGAAGLDKAVQSATQKMSAVLQDRIRLTNRAVWQLFGVGKQYDSLHPAPKPPAPQKPQSSANGWSIKKL